MQYIHKQTGTIVSKDCLKEQLDRGVQTVTFSDINRRGISEFLIFNPIITQDYYIKDIPFSDDFEVVGEFSLSIEELQTILRLRPNGFNPRTDTELKQLQDKCYLEYNERIRRGIR